jgi:hypothetical protein
LNRIRGWVRQGRTDAWIAHQLEVTVQQIQAFKREQALEPDADPDTTVAISDFDDEIDLRAEDDALIAAELDAEAAAAAEEPEPEQEDEDDKPKRRRGRRGGRTTRTKRKAGGPWEATFDHGEEGIGLWLDPAVQDDPVYAESWAGHRPVEVTIEEDQIVIRRAGAEAEADDAPAAAEEAEEAPSKKKPDAEPVSEEPELDSSSEEPEPNSSPEESEGDSDEEPEED